MLALLTSFPMFRLRGLGTALIRAIDIGVFHYLVLPDLVLPVPSLVLCGIIFMMMVLFIPTGPLNARLLQERMQRLGRRFEAERT